MLMLGWITNDYRGRKAWAAFWSMDDTLEKRADAQRYINENKMEFGAVYPVNDVASLANAKKDVLEMVWQAITSAENAA